MSELDDLKAAIEAGLEHARIESWNNNIDINQQTGYISEVDPEITSAIEATRELLAYLEALEAEHAKLRAFVEEFIDVGSQLDEEADNARGHIEWELLREEYTKRFRELYKKVPKLVESK